MPLPIAHSLCGYALSEMQSLPFFDRKWKTVLFFAILANAPDFDFLPGFFVGNPSRFHHGVFHTLGAALLAGFLGAVGFRKKLPFWKTFSIVGFVYYSHILLDYFTEDCRPPYGVMLFWPFTDAFFTSPIPLFIKVTRSNDPLTFFSSLFNSNNLAGALREIGIMGAVCVLVAIVKRLSGACRRSTRAR